MTSWEIAKYFIDCKKDIDSIIYISENVRLISNLNLKGILNLLLSCSVKLQHNNSIKPPKSQT